MFSDDAYLKYNSKIELLNITLISSLSLVFFYIMYPYLWENPLLNLISSIKFFSEHGYTWDSVVKAFESKGLTSDEALLNARLAKILTADDYDFKENRPILWTPTNASD